ncbi:MAG: FHA domain-containing protein [Labilithrix sp.]|nr:FHA domain-containing protein [Labilithrix sp.]
MSIPTPPPRGPTNARTAVPYPISAWHARRRPTSPSDAWAKAVEVERQRLRFQPRPGAGYRLYVVTEGVVGGREVSPAPGGHAVLGRHTSCDLVLGDDTSISLRHVLVRAWTHEGLAMLGVLDLDSGTGFELSDGSRQRAVVASGPVVFAIAATSIVAVPLGEPLAEGLEPPIVRSSEASGYQVDPRPREGSRDASARAGTGRITVVPWSVPLSSGGVGGAFEMVLESEHRRAVVRFSERDVGHGILVGRDPRCVDAGLRSVLNDGISRVHALVIRERDGVRLYDVASMNGMTDGARRVRSMALDDAGGRAFLCGYRTTALSWRALRSAGRPSA